MKSRMKALFIVAFVVMMAGSQQAFAQCGCTHFVGLTIADYIWDAAAKNVKPGDKICFTSGTRTGIEFKNIKGTADKPVIIANMCDGKVTVDAPLNWGNAVAFTNSQYYIVDGSANPAVEYGIEVKGGQAGLNNQLLSSDFEVHHVYVHDTGCTGLMGKTDPTCDPATQRGNFTLRNAIFHHNKLANTGCEGFYIGNSHYDNGKPLTCNGLPVTVQEHDIIGVKVYNCILDNIGNDGIQIGSSKEVVVHHNIVRNVGVKNNVAHQNLIQMGGGTHGAIVYNNYCENGGGFGLYESGGGGTYFNNVVINALYGGACLQDPAPNFAPTGARFYNNTFINCLTDGLLMYSEHTDPTLWYNNINVGPVAGTYNYIRLNNASKNKITESNNLNTKDVNSVKFVDVAAKNFRLLATATGAIDKGKDLTAQGIISDLDENARPKGAGWDIGAFEYQPGGPKANAGADQTMTLPTNATTITGSGTSATGITGYQWTKKSGPAATLANETTATLTLSALVEGTYVFELRVTDAAGFDFDNVTITVNATTANQNPTVNLGGVKTITLPTNTLTINGLASDPDGTISSYLWQKISGPVTGTLGPPVNTQNINLSGLVQGTYTIMLIVTDNKGATGSGQTQVIVNPAAANQLPVVNAGSNKSIFLPTNNVSLTATASDPDGTIQTILWEKKVGGAATVGPPTNGLTVNVTGLALGNYTFRCTVTDNKGATAFSEVGVNVLQGNQPPVVDAGANQTITLPTSSVVLTATASDPDGTISAYAWTKIFGPAVAVVGGSANQTLNVTSMTQGTYIFGVNVTDNQGATAYDEVTVSVSVSATPSENPIAIAGGNISLSLPTSSVNLYGSGFDPDGKINSYLWTRQSGAGVTMTNTTSPTLSLAGLTAGQYEFRLRVIDDSGASDIDVAVVTVSDPGTNQHPIAEAGFDKIVKLPQTTVLLEGSGSDDDGNVTTYGWTKVSGTGSAIASPAASTTSITGLSEGVYTFRLTVTDNDGASDFNDVVVRVVTSTANTPPVVSAGADKTIFLPTNSTTLNATADDDGSITAYQWAKLSGPAATLANPTELNLNLTGLVQGEYSFQLAVTDNNEASVFDIVRLSVLPAAFQPPTVSAGADQSITKPTSTVTLTGTATAPPGSTVASTTWSKVLGPNATLAGANTLTLNVTAMEVGTYVFELKIIDSNGNQASDNVEVVVNELPGNQAPVVTAGSNASITLPINSVVFNGTAVDSDGTISNLLWTQVSGPANATLVNANTINLTANNLVEGPYVFRLTATDDKGATGNGEVLVFVAGTASAENRPPVVFAGEDVLINLKDGITEYVMLGNAIDPDGTITSFEWSQFAGPETTFEANQQTLTITALERGQFGYRFTATDEANATASDDVVVSVIGENDEIPKFFSPNNDGQGDVWVFRNIDSYQTCRLSVFARSGQVVYEANPYQNNWDGTYNGKPLTNGDYYYNLVCDDGKKVAGALRIIR